MSNPNWITVDVEAYLTDTPPHDTEIPGELISKIAKEVAETFDYVSVYDKIDQLACAVMRKHGLID